MTDAEATVADRSVPVPGATIDERGWLVIHPEASGGGPNGAVTLAERQLEPGAHEDLSLTLDTLVAGEQTLYAMLHYDDPADGEFTFPESGDPPVTVDGSPVIEPFTVAGTGDFAPALAVTDQKTDGTTVAMPRATIDGTGWLVIHPEASGGGPNGGVTLAERRLQRGTYGSVALDLSRSLSEDQTLYAMLHYDDPADGEFTFPESGDPAVTAGGSPVIKPFDLTVSDGSGTSTVEMRDTSFDPVRLSVAPGTTVEWINRDGYAHDVTSAQFHDTATSWDYESGDLGQGETATHTFEESGVYEYYCTIHGETRMCGAVLVGDVSLDKDLPCEGGGAGGY
ncbi:MAG: plastocyanin/azurin family copper-binding protein [Haloferacaceae archaeon]